MASLITFLGVIISIATFIFIPLWLKKNSKGGNDILRIIIGGFFSVVILLITHGLSSSTMTDKEKEEKRINDSIRQARILHNQFIKDSIAQVMEIRRQQIRDSLEAEYNKPAKSEWKETSSKDEMTDATNVWMTLKSDNSFEFDYPYNGGTRLKIEVRYRKQDGNQVILSVNKGQLMESTSYQRNEVVVRFDEDEPMHFTTNEPADHSSNMLFLNNPRRFINRAKNAHKILIQVPTFENGQPIFSFEPAEPLKWEY